MKILSIVGARPNFMKIAPFLAELRNHPEIESRLVHTGQHYDEGMSDAFFRDLNIPAPDVNLEVGSGTHAEQTAKVMLAFEPVLLAEKPDWVVVVGDVNSTAACTLVAVKLGVKVAHIEAGLRSFDRRMPEEINRLVTDALADLLLTPSPDADENLFREGVAPEKIKFVGNIMIDTLFQSLERAKSSQLLEKMELAPQQFAVVTLHRPSNVDDGTTLTGILEALGRLQAELPVVFPVHPRTRGKLAEFGILEKLAGWPYLRLCEPLGYLDFLRLWSNSRLVLTDSGGLQEETTALGIPCLTLRENTERPVTVTHGTNRIVGIDPAKIDAAVKEILHGTSFPKRIPELWDGQTARRIVECLLNP
ncbi:MAG: UDP-N-acetylglucosamine 2-epimerase (non-hydrolyzing) [Blastocatellia bacterium]|nr:UDP-N-acetylglucosamine 2-epimerase (non-hydrolyzing) [Blastocatellia bacterium]